jgi:hypothetical protein
MSEIETGQRLAENRKQVKVGDAPVLERDMTVQQRLPLPAEGGPLPPPHPSWLHMPSLPDQAHTVVSASSATLFWLPHVPFTRHHAGRDPHSPCLLACPVGALILCGHCYNDGRVTCGLPFY